MSRNPRFFPLVVGVALAGVAIYVFSLMLERPSDSPSDEVSEPEVVQGDGSQDRNAEDEASHGTELAVTPVTIATTATARRETKDRDLLSAEKDGWVSEHFAELAGKQLKSILATIGSGKPLVNVHGATVADTVAIAPFRPDELDEVFRDPSIVVRTLSDPAKVVMTNASSSEIGSRLRAAVPFEQTDAFHSHVKIVSVDLSPDGNSIQTKAFIELSNSNAERSWQSNATWLCDWSRKVEDSLQLSAIRLVGYRESEFKPSTGSTNSENGKWFVDRTNEIAGHNAAFEEQLKFGHHYWLQRIERSHRFDTSVRNGIAIGDVNGDGLDDVYVCQPPGLPNLLLIHQSDGTAVNQAATSGVDWLDQTSGAIFADLDNDGDQDLAIGTPTETLVMTNDGTGKFTLKTTLAHDYDVQSLSVVDFDSDGLLDVFVCLYRTATPPPNQHFLYRDATGGGQNRLFKNTMQDGDLSFADVTESAGLTDGGDRYTLAASWEDFDNDGDPDLYVANDFGKNYLYRNDGGKFVNVAPTAGVEDIGSGMSVAWGDYDRDGFVDLYVGNMFSSAGNRVTTQPGFRAEEDAETREIYRRLAKGNSLFKNRGDGTFAEVGADAGVELGRWAWSSLFADINNDGWDDLVVANGYITTPDSGDL